MEPKRLTDERLAQIRDWMSKREGDTNLSYDEEVILLLLPHVALSSVPDDVARDERAVRAVLIHSREPSTEWEPHLSSLAAAASRVPGLEAELEEAKALTNVLQRGAQDAETREQGLRAMADTAQSLLGSAEAERDALTARVAELERELTNLRTDVQVVWGQKVTAAEARATGAEQEVKAVEDALWQRSYACQYPGRPAVEVAAALDKLQQRLDAQSTPAPGLREAVDEQLRRVRKAITDEKAKPRPSGARVAEWRMAEVVLEPLAAYETTSREPVVTHAQLAAVVEAYAKECAAFAQQWPNIAGDWSAAKGASHELLRRVTGGEVPEALSKAQVLEVLAQYKAGFHIARDLGLTLPTGPGGGEAEEEPLSPEDQRLIDEAWERHKTRARIAPTPTPEVPALAEDVCGDCSQPVAEHRDGGKAESCEARSELAERVMWSIVAPDAQPEPAAPGVTWEDPRGFRVMPYGAGLVLECQMDDGTWDELDVQTPKAAVMFAQSLARALAEAKREAQGNRVGHLVRQELFKDARRKAAEAMRERCLTIIWDRIKAGKDDLRGAWEEIHAAKVD